MLCGQHAGSPVGTEVSFREGTTRSGLQVPFEPHGLSFSRELDHDHERPRAVFGGVSTRSVVVPFQAVLRVARQANVVTVKVEITSKDVDEPLADSAHAGAKAILGPICCGTIRSVTVGLRHALSSRVRRFCNTSLRSWWRKLRDSRFTLFDDLLSGTVRIQCSGPTSLGLRSLRGLRLGLRRDSLRVSVRSRALGDQGTDADLLA